MRTGDTVFRNDTYIGDPIDLKRQSDLRKAVLSLLDLLAENGPSAAF